MKISLVEKFDADLEKQLTCHPHTSFLQSFAWQDFQKSLDRKTFFLKIVEGKKILLTCLVTKMPLRFGFSYLYSPHGPMVFSNNEKVWSFWLEEIKKIAKREKAIFYRLDPKIATRDKLFENIAQKFSFEKTKKEVQPRETLILDLSMTDEELLKAMHPKTRYNLRLAKRKGVKVKISAEPKDLKIFYQLAQKTKERDQFNIHSENYYQKQFEVLASKDHARLFIAYFNETPLAANLVTFYGTTCTYLHGASGNEHRNLMAPHLLQWEQILEAKKRGLKTYDFWGITTSKNPDHSWQGITRFKKGFGGTAKSSVGAYDLVFNKFLYQLYRLAS